MPNPIPPTVPGAIMQGFLALAQQRKANLVDMYDTGRWRHYYTEAEFTARMREVVGLAEAWDKIAASAPGPVSAVSLSVQAAK